MCTALLPPAVNTTAVNKYIKYRYPYLQDNKLGELRIEAKEKTEYGELELVILLQLILKIILQITTFLA